MKDTQKQKKITLDDLYALMYENEEKSKREWERISKKSDEEWEKIREETEKRSKEWKKRSEESDRKWKKRSEEIREEQRKRSEAIDELLAENARIIGGIGNSNGEVAEEYFQNAFEINPKLNGETYDKVITNMNVKSEKGRAEFDIFLSNDKSSAIIEIKYNVRERDVKKIIAELLQKSEKFRNFLPEYNNRKLYLGIASLSFRKNTEKKFMENGIAVIKQVGDKMVIYDKNLKEY